MPSQIADIPLFLLASVACQQHPVCTTPSQSCEIENKLARIPFHEMVHFIQCVTNSSTKVVKDLIHEVVIILGFENDPVFKTLRLLHDKVKYLYLHLAGDKNACFQLTD